MRLAGSCVFVTGAASGLGRATVEALHAAGARVVLADINADKLDAATQALGERALPVVMDVRDADQIEAALDRARQAFGPVRVVVSCAGISSAAKLVSRGQAHDLEVWRRVLDINLTGVFNVMRLAAVQMADAPLDPDSGERGVIINTASIAAFDGQKGQAAYAASKAGVVGLTLPAARDLAGFGIRCVAIAPGLFETELFEQIPEKGIEALKRGLLYPPRMGRPQEFAGFVRHIAENPYVNGATLRLDGGARLPA
jgi:NAD(P)-dependent dehydrogenase (short-subunit alcohol dehydrogenase family)